MKDPAIYRLAIGIPFRAESDGVADYASGRRMGLSRATPIYFGRGGERAGAWEYGRDFVHATGPAVGWPV